MSRDSMARAYVATADSISAVGLTAGGFTGVGCGAAEVGGLTGIGIGTGLAFAESVVTTGARVVAAEALSRASRLAVLHAVVALLSLAAASDTRPRAKSDSAR